MSIVRTNHVTYAFVAKNMNRQATTILNPSSATYIKEGEVVLANKNGNIVIGNDSTTYANDEMRIVYRTDKGMMKSPVIKASNVTSYKVSPYKPATNKVMYIGYNGVSGNIENNSYIIGTTLIVNMRKLSLLNHFYDNVNYHKDFNTYVTADDRCQVIRGLVKNGVDNFNDQYGADTFVKIEAVSSAASSAASATVNFVEGSKLAVATGASGISVGDFVRPLGAAKTNAIYYVENVDGNNIYLEVPYQGESCSVTPHVLTSANTSDFGIKLSGRDKAFDSTNNKFRFDIADFEVNLKNFENTTITKSVSADIGVGDWRSVAQLEWEVQDMFGQTSHTDWLMPSRKRYFEEDVCYDILTLEAYDDRTDTLAGTPKSKFSIVIPIPKQSTQGDDAGIGKAPGIATALDLWLTANTGRTYNEDANLTV